MRVCLSATHFPGLPQLTKSEGPIRFTLVLRKTVECLRLRISDQSGQVSRLCSFRLLSCSSKYVREIYRARLWGRHICAAPRSTNMAAGNNEHIWFQYRHKFDQLFTAKEQIIRLTYFLILLSFKGHMP